MAAVRAGTEHRSAGTRAAETEPAATSAELAVSPAPRRSSTAAVNHILLPVRTLAQPPHVKLHLVQKDKSQMQEHLMLFTKASNGKAPSRNVPRMILNTSHA